MRNVLEDLKIKKLFVLLNLCTSNPLPLLKILLEALGESEVFKIWRDREHYDFINENALRIFKRLDKSMIDVAVSWAKKPDLDTPPKMNVADLYEYYRQLTELTNLANASEKNIMEDKLDNLSIVHKDWAGYLEKVARKLCYRKIVRINPDSVSIQKLKFLSLPEKGSPLKILEFIAELNSGISEHPNNMHDNITNFHYANCFEIFKNDVTTKLPAKPLEGQYLVYHTPYQNVSKIYPDRFFCISPSEYERFNKSN